MAREHALQFVPRPGLTVLLTCKSEVSAFHTQRHMIVDCYSSALFQVFSADARPVLAISLCPGAGPGRSPESKSHSCSGVTRNSGVPGQISKSSHPSPFPTLCLPFAPSLSLPLPFPFVLPHFHPFFPLPISPYPVLPCGQQRKRMSGFLTKLE